MPKTTYASPSRPDLYLPDGWDTGWKAAKSAKTPRILCYGDSITVGQTLTNVQTLSWSSLLKAALLSSLGINCVSEYWAQNGSNAATNHPWSAALNGVTLGTQNGFGWHYTFMVNGTTSAQYQTYTTPDACTGFDIFFDDFIAGTWQFIVDSGTAGNSFNWAISGNGSGSGTTNVNVTITNLGTGTAANAVIRRLSITGLPSGVHTFGYGWQSVAFTAPMLGAAHSPNAGTGLKLARMAVAGQILANMAGQKPANSPRLLAGFTPQQDGQTTLGFGFPVDGPDLAIISNVANDTNAGAANLSTYEQITQRIVQGLKRNNPSVSIILLITAYPNADDADTSTSFANQYLYSQFCGALYRVAQAERCAVANIHSRWGEAPNGQGFMPNNSVHPNSTGHQDIANFLLTLL